MTLTKILNDSEVNSIDLDEVIEEEKKNILKKFTPYISLPNRTNYIFKQVNNYPRDEKRDKDILLFAGGLRNTMHNNGKHIKNDMKLELKGHTLELKKGEVTNWGDYENIFILANEIFDIYIAILESI